MATKNQYIKLLSDYDKHCLRIAKATSIDINEKHADKLKRIAHNEKEYLRWFEYYFPNYAKKKSAWFHKKLADAIIKNKKIKALMEAYRSSGKSVHIDLGIPLYLYLVLGELHFMLLVGETHPKAKKLLSGIQAQLQYNHRLINDYGNKFQQGDWADGEFLTADGVRFMAIGFGMNPRGAREGEERPDYIAVDDVDNKKHVKNNELMSDGMDFITEDVWGLFDADDDATERFVYANNNFHKNSITNRLVLYFKQKIKEAKEKGRNHSFFHLRVDAVKDINTFEPNWPDKTTAQYWRNKYEDMPYRSFMREYMNTHIAEGKILKAEWIQYAKILKYDIGLVLDNAREDVVGYLEPYFSTIYCDTEIAVDYLSSELRLTNTDINTKFKPLDSLTDNDIVVKCNCDDLLAEHNRFQFLTMLPMVITDNNSLGKFRYDVFDISVNKLTEYQKSLVKV
jgi:hypothetical protein